MCSSTSLSLYPITNLVAPGAGAGLGLGLLNLLVGRADLAPAEVGVGDLGEGLNLDNVGRGALALGAGAGLAVVEPLHVAALVPPDAHGQDHAAGEGLAHALGGAELHVLAGAGGGAELVLDHVGVGDALLVGVEGLDDLAVLHVEAVDLLELALAVGKELGDDGEGLESVDLELLAPAVVVSHVDAVGVPAAAVLVADTFEGALLTLAEVQALLVADVGSHVRGARVGLPDIHLVAARALALDVALEEVSVSEMSVEQ
jgi:hypothetical protein